jgi:hypothetical protein
MSKTLTIESFYKFIDNPSTTNELLDVFLNSNLIPYKRKHITVEPNKFNLSLKGNGPYKWLEHN